MKLNDLYFKYKRMKHYILIVLAIAFFGCKESKEETFKAEVLPYFNSADFTPEWKKGSHKIPQFSFTNQNGENITNNTYKDKIYVADFFFTTCPGICPKLTKNMGSLQDAYKNDDDIMLLSHSVMPWVDNVEKLKAYSLENSVNPKKWNLVTGDKDALYNIARHGYFADEDFAKTKDEDEFIHTENFILVDKQGYIRGVYNGTIALDVKRLRRHIEILKEEV